MTGGPCEVCGGTGLKDLIAACTRCGAREHIYCMRILSFEILDVWLCDECQSLKIAESQAVRGFDSSRDVVGHGKALVNCVMPKWKKTSENTKVKFLSEEESIKLASGEMGKGSPSCHNLGSAKLRLNRGIWNSKYGEPSHAGDERGSFKGCTLASKPPKVQAEQTDAYPRVVKPKSGQERGVAEKATKEAKNASLAQKQLSREEEKAAYCRVVKPKYSQEGGVAEKATQDAKGGSLAQKWSSEEGAKAYDATEARNVKDESQGPLDILPHLTLLHPYLPALHATWKGGFKFMDSATSANFYGGFRAQPPCRVHRNAYEFSKKMTPVLQVEMLSVDCIVGALFGDKEPSLHNVAFYLFLDDATEKCRQKSAYLFALLDIQRSAIRSYIEGVELLIFTSKQLCAHSQSVIRAVKDVEYFLWGIFRCRANSTPFSK